MYDEYTIDASIATSLRPYMAEDLDMTRYCYSLSAHCA